ncbi:MAG TPA: trypsin-like serine protease [Dongiaceae bacterium]|nr:trypsin-like serine protease [Dongiaceae bacterium]
MPVDVRYSATALLAALLLAIPVAVAQDGTEIVGIEGTDNRKPVGAKDWPWVALGQVNREIGGHCTGALIAPNLVLTAAHCLYNFNDGRMTIPMEVHFVAGYQRGEYREHAVGRDFIVSPDWNPKDAESTGNIENDWAVIELERSLSIKPIPLSHLDFEEVKTASEEGELTIAAYNGDYGEILTRDKGCELAGQSEDGRLLLHECDATFGASGAPLLLATSAGAEIVGLQSAVIENQNGKRYGAAVPVETIRDGAGLD